MKPTHIALLVGTLVASTGCDSFLDVNTNPNGPQTVSANLYLPPMLHWFVSSPQFDGRFVGHYTQQWYSTSTATSPGLTWGRMGYDPASDNGAQQWRDVYWSLGQNLIDMNAKATAEQRWDLLGVGLILKAWGWQVLTDLHGEIIVQQAIDQHRTKFDYDTQEYAYQEVQRLLDSAIVLLNRTDGAVNQPYLAVGDKIYNGDRLKWLKLAHGLLALHLNHFSNKASYDPDSVIAEVDRSFAGNVDDALLSYPCGSTDFADCNFWGRSRNNLTLYRQTQFVVNLMNGTAFGGAVDPRMSRMLAIDSANAVYRGLDVNVTGFGALTATQQPRNFFGYTGTNGLNLPARYIFADRSKIPAMTYSQLQFIKAEAALRSGNAALARTAYINAISTHIDFVNARNLDAGQTPAQITGGEKTAFLADTNIVPATVTLSHIMTQKYIAQWGWGHNEVWMDMRRYHYTDLDPVSGVQVFRGFAAPTALYADNTGKVVQRIRPRYNSEYVWNLESLRAIGGDAVDYHTKPIWIIEP
jgi:hypothetical protein